MRELRNGLLDSTVQACQFDVLQRSLQRSLVKRGSNANIVEGDNFKLSIEVLSAKR